MKKRVLILCPNTWDRENLTREPIASRYELSFAGEELVEWPTLWKGLRFDVFRWVRAVSGDFAKSGLSGVVGTGDYPGCMLAAEVGATLGLPVPGPDKVVHFSHKYYSRKIQQGIVPEATPRFAPVDPSGDFASAAGLECPFFVKPVKGTMSIRARPVKRHADLEAAVRLSPRERLMAYLLFKPFQQLLEAYSDREVPAHHFIAEGLLSGQQVTVDGFVEGGRAVIMGVVDSVMYPGTMSFKRFDYPSTLPESVQSRMGSLAARLMEQSGFDQSCFNVEMFYDPTADTIRIIEVNPRMSYQFADLYARVDGKSTYEVQLALATGEPVGWRAGNGRDKAAASFVMRRFEDGVVLQVPTSEQIRAVERRFPGTTVKILCSAGERLGRQDQDVGSYRYAIVNMAASSVDELHANHGEVERSLTFRFGHRLDRVRDV